MSKSGHLRPTEPSLVWPGAPPGEDTFRALVESVREYAIMLLDRDGIVRSWNAGAELIQGYAAPEVIGQHISVFYTPAEAARGWPQRALAAAARAGRTEDEGWRVRKDGMRFWAHVVLTALRDPDGELYGFGKIVRDLTDDKRREEALRRSEERSLELREQAMRDPLTGAFNRRHMLDYLRDAIDRAVLMTASLLVLDVDRFKEVNDGFGHDAGDRVLAGVASVARAQLRTSDQLFRVGGDEFLIFLPGVAAPEAAAVAERLRDAVENAALLDAQPVTVSIGVAQLRPEDSTETWIQAGDAAMYEAKRRGRNRVV